MRVTRDKFVRRYVYDWAVGDVPVKRVMRNGVQIWPAENDRIRTMAVDIDGTDPYWRHAMDATAVSSSATTHIALKIAHRTYMVNTSYNNYPLVRYSLGILDFGDDGPPLGEVRVGDVITLRAVIAQRNSLEYEGEATCNLPYLTNTQLRVRWSKGKKRKWAGRRFTVTGNSSGVVHYGGSCETSEHKRGCKTRYLPGNTHKWYNRVYNNVMPEGDENLSISTQAIGSGHGYGVTMVWPAFEKDFKVTVTAISE